MNIKITGKELKATDAIKNYIDTKSDRLQKYFDTENIDLFVTIKKEGEDQVAEMQISVSGESFRAVTASRDLYSSINILNTFSYSFIFSSFDISLYSISLKAVCNASLKRL